MTETLDGITADSAGIHITIPKRYIIILVSALLSGIGSGINGITQDVSDRFKGDDFIREIAVRDAKIAFIEAEIKTFRKEQATHFQHSATYTERIDTDRGKIKENKQLINKHIEQGH